MGRPLLPAAGDAFVRSPQDPGRLDMVADGAPQDGVVAVQPVVQQALGIEKVKGLRAVDGHTQRVLPVEHVAIVAQGTHPLQQRA